MNLGLGCVGYEFGIGFRDVALGLDSLIKICGRCGPCMDFPPEIWGPYGP